MINAEAALLMNRRVPDVSAPVENGEEACWHGVRETTCCQFEEDGGSQAGPLHAVKATVQEREAAVVDRGARAPAWPKVSSASGGAAGPNAGIASADFTLILDASPTAGCSVDRVMAGNRGSAPRGTA